MEMHGDVHVHVELHVNPYRGTCVHVNYLCM